METRWRSNHGIDHFIDGVNVLLARKRNANAGGPPSHTGQSPRTSSNDDAGAIAGIDTNPIAELNAERNGNARRPTQRHRADLNRR